MTTDRRLNGPKGLNMDLALSLSLSRSDDEISKERQSSLAFSPTAATAATAATRMGITHKRGF